MKIDVNKKAAKPKALKKKIFVTGAVREYNSDSPELLAREMEDYIRQNIVSPDCADQVQVIVTPSGPKDVTITMPFSTGDKLYNDEISMELYRCFTGECVNFTAQNTLLWGCPNFGPNYPMSIRYSIEQTIEYHKKNTRFYKANRYKSMEMYASMHGLCVVFHF